MPRLLSRLQLAFHHLSLRVTLVALSIMGVLVFVIRLLGTNLPWWGVVILFVITAGVLYHHIEKRLAERLNLARFTLRQIRKHQFANLDATQLPPGDELNDLIRQVYRTGEAMEKEFNRFKKIENYRRDFLGHVSHELKTPIFSIRGFTETLLNGALEDSRVNRSFLRKILHNAERLANLTNDLSEVARIETGELKMVKQPFDLPAMVQQILDSFEPLVGERKIHLKGNIPDNLPLVMADPDRIQQVLINLIENAIKYNAPGGYVDVKVQLLAAQEITTSVVDNGIGIDQEHLPRLTERFYRVDTSRSRSQGGTGLGLAIVKHILGAHNRTLVVDSKPGSGSTFSFTLPTVHQPVEETTDSGVFATAGT